jgi:hypothetical protein
MVGDSTGGVGTFLANGDTTALVLIDTTPDRSSAGVGVVIADTGVAIDRVVDRGGSTQSATTRLASAFRVCAAPAEGANPGTDVPVWLPDVRLEAAGNEKARCRQVEFVGRVFDSAAERVGAGTSATEVSCAARVLAVGVPASEEAVGPRSSGAVGAASSDVLELLRAPRVLTAFGFAERFAGADDPDEELGGDDDSPVEELDAESDEEEPELEGWAEATPGHAASRLFDVSVNIQVPDKVTPSIFTGAAKSLDRNGRSAQPQQTVRRRGPVRW